MIDLGFVLHISKNPNNQWAGSLTENKTYGLAAYLYLEHIIGVQLVCQLEDCFKAAPGGPYRVPHQAVHQAMTRELSLPRG